MSRKKTFAALVLIVGALTACDKKPPAPSGPVTFNEHIAPILFANCTPCHQPDQSAPFELLSFADASKHARDIAEVTRKRYMPPWLPEHGYGEFVSERRLSDAQIDLIQRWVAEGAQEGTAPLAARPQIKTGWDLGEPDLIVEPPAPYTLAAEGRDVYYNFVVPIPLTQNKFVEAVELLPGKNRSLHHAFINIDETRASRRLGATNTPPGFPGMDTPESAMMPGGQLLGWQPGKIPSIAPPGLAWILRTNSDLVLQAHLNPSGKRESIQPRLGFHFTTVAPTNSAFRIRLNALQLDIPAGVSNYVAEESYTVPVDVDMVRVGAHAHYLCREMQGYALLPSGEKKWLLWIKDWNFQWQGDYQYKEPVRVPKGSKLVMRFTYDNSTNNIRNPFNPPRRTFWGLQTTDEMGELYFQALPRNRDDYMALGRDYTRELTRVSMDFYRFRIKKDPTDADAHQLLGRSLATIGQPQQAVPHLLEAIRLNPNHDKARFDLGSIYMRMQRIQEAYNEFAAVVRINPDDAQAHGSLGVICFHANRHAEAREHLANALRLNPDDPLALSYMRRLN